MAKLTKFQTRCHNKALALLEKDQLTLSEREEVFGLFHEAAHTMNGESGAFFTPLVLANDLKIDMPGGRIVDICAGIGALTFASIHYRGYDDNTGEHVCIELNPLYVEVGKKLVPEATWICADALDPATWAGLGQFDGAISNPPFGQIKTSDHLPPEALGQFEYAVLIQASKIARAGAFILPQQAAPFRYSGRPFYERKPSARCQKFEQLTGILMEAGCGVDTSVHKDSWHHPVPTTEIVTCEFDAQEQLARISGPLFSTAA